MTALPADSWPEPGSSAERAAFADLQASLRGQFREVFPDRAAARTVIVLPSLSLDEDILSRITGMHHYEERMLGMLMLLRLPRTRLIYLTSEPLSDTIVDYYLHLLQGVPAAHARARLTLLSCFDGGPRPLTEKILERPRLMARLKAAIGDAAAAHISAYTVSPLERTLAVRLAAPLYGCDPDLLTLGAKSGGRRLMREAGVTIPDGVEDLRSAGDIARALTALKTRDPNLRRAVVKLNEGFSGEGNGLFRFDDAPPGPDLAAWIEQRLPGLALVAPAMAWPAYLAKVEAMGAIVEAYVEGSDKRSPSAQFRIDPLGGVELISTHDQVLGGPSGQVYLGCHFPADAAYRLSIQAEGLKVARALADRGVLGRFSIDFVCVREAAGWRSHAIEINLRKGGTTHPFLMLQFLTGGAFRGEDGQFLTPTGEARYYFASDNLEAPHYRGLTPADLVDISVVNELHYDGARHEGVVFHLIGALSEFGKLGVVCVGATPARAQAYYRRAVEILDRERPVTASTAP